MRRITDRVRKLNDNAGMSIVTVIVAIGFVAILVSIVLLASAVNFKMKSVNVYSKESFYSAEQVLDEINVGLQRVVSDGLRQSYKKLLENYNTDELTSEEKNALVKAEYYKYVWSELGVDATPDEYYYVMPKDIDTDSLNTGLFSLLKSSTKWGKHGGEEYYGAFLRAGTYEADGYYVGKLSNYDKTGIVLEDLTVYYKDPDGFVSAIRTDIRIGYPDFDFSNNNMAAISTYAFITDTMLEQTVNNVTKASASKTVIEGNSYAYAVNIRGVRHEYEELEDDLDVHIVAGEYNVANGGVITNKNSVLWAGDIGAKSSDLTLAGQAFVKDDLNITGKNSIIKLNGYYTGFGNSLDDSSSSSAILVNGTNTTIDLSNVKKLSLAGRAYIGLGSYDKYKTKIGEVDEEKDKPKNVYTGESIAIKSNQLMYLVPGESIGCRISEDAEGNKVVGSSLYAKNPLTLTEYNEMMSKVGSGDAMEISTDKKVSRLNNLPLEGYIKKKSDGSPDVEKLFIRTSTGSNLVYYYMKFDSDEMANEYFKIYYAANRESVERYMSKYLKSLTLPTEGIVTVKVDMAALAEAGAASRIGNAEGAYELLSARSSRKKVTNAEGEDEYTQVYNSISETFADESESYESQYTAYISKLTSDLDSLPSGTLIRKTLDADDTRYAVFENIIDEEMLKEAVPTGTSRTYEDPSSKGKAIIYNMSNVNATVTPDSSYDLIIANCNVDLSGSKHVGTIIAKGKISAPASYEFKADSEIVQECLALYDSADGVYKVSDVFRDVDAGSIKSVVEGTDGEVTTASLVTYENWTKSVDIE